MASEQGKSRGVTPREIDLGYYNGTGHDFMRLNDGIAQGYVRVADLRHNVTVVKKSGSDDVVTTKREGNTFFIGIDDEQITSRVQREDSSAGNFEDRFTKAFGGELRRGLRTTLKDEKLKNGENYDPTFYAGYLGFFTTSIISLHDVVYAAANYSSIHDKPEVALAVAVAVTKLNLIVNSFNAMAGLITSAKSPRPDEELRRRSFVRTDFPLGPFLPSVPVDHLIRGNLYLAGKGRKMVERSDK